MTLTNLTRKNLWFLLGSFATLFMADFFITKSYLSHIGTYGEFNPLMRWVAEAFGVNAIAWTKLAGVCTLGVLIAIIETHLFKRVYISLVALNVLIAFVVAYGIFCYLTLF